MSISYSLNEHNSVDKTERKNKKRMIDISLNGVLTSSTVFKVLMEWMHRINE